ncbi:hypothetical protein BJ973_004693 [Actinoplanes tereljensis]|nr:hypothetical protein [Actinoplanes tereljensis]
MAARRWPAGIRDEMAREWHAELAAIEAEPGGRRRALGYALSLLTSPPLRDRTGAPRGWAETTGPLAPAGALLLTALLTIAAGQLAGSLTSLLFSAAGFESYAMTWLPAVAEGLLTGAWCLLAGWWLGRRLPLEPTARLGAATSAAFAPLLIAVAVLIPAFVDQDLFYLVSLLIGLLVWVPGVAVLGVAVVRGRRLTLFGVVVARGRRLALLGLPLISAAAAAAATLPMVVSSRDSLSGGLRAAAASLLAGSPTAEYTVIEDGLSSRAFYYLGPWAITLMAFGILALAFGAAALRPLPGQALTAAAAASTAETEASPARRTPVVVAVGASCVALAVIAWAYTVTILSPAMPGVSATAPMPGGDGEIYLWVAELRWGAILLAALAMLVATADRRRALAASLVLAAALVVANGVLVRAGAAGAGGLQLTLLIGGIIVIVAWLVARGPIESSSQAGAADQVVAVPGMDGPGGGAGSVGRMARRRVVAAGVVAAACAPLLLTQGTPGVNHPFLPAGLTLTTTGLAVLGVLLAAVPAVALSRRRVPVWAAVALVVVPVVVVVAAGLAPVPVDTEDTGYASFGALAGLPLAVLVVALLRRHRERRRGRTAAVWVLLVLAALPGTVLLLVASLFLGQIVPNLLFATEGRGYPADGLSIVPGAALLMAAVAALAAARLDGMPGRGHRPGPWPAPDPVRPDPVRPGEAVPG